VFTEVAGSLSVFYAAQVCCSSAIVATPVVSASAVRKDPIAHADFASTCDPL